MPRIARGLLGGGLFHVLNRGNHRQPLFRHPQEFAAFLELLAGAVAKFHVRLWGYCLMGNHWHLVAEVPSTQELSRWLHWLRNRHVRTFHQTNAALGGGHLYQGRYKKKRGQASFPSSLPTRKDACPLFSPIKMNTASDYLFRVEPPWIYVGVGELERMKWIPSYFYSRSGMNVCVRNLRGKKMRTVQALMDEFGAALQFFEGFGENWYALEECLQYMDEWLPAEAYVLIVEGAEELLLEEQPNQMSALLKTLHLVGEWWARPVLDNGRFNRQALPFHVLLNLSQSFSAQVQQILSVAQDINVPIRI